MKNTSRILTFFILAIAYMTACNPIDEGQLPPSTVEGNTLNQVLSNIQGQWYVKKVQFIQGPVCAGGSNEVFWEYIADNTYNTYKFEFTMNSANSCDDIYQSDLDSSMAGIFQFYGNGGNFTSSYLIFDDSWMGISSVDNIIDGDKYIKLAASFSGYQGVGLNSDIYEIISLDQNVLILQTLTGNRRIFFERGQENDPLLMTIPIQGEYKLSEERYYLGGVLNSVNQTFQEFHLIFSQNQDSFNQQKWFVGSLIGQHSPFNIASGNSAVSGPVYFNTTATHLSTSNFPQHFKIAASSSTQLILREEANCNDYTDYVFEKVN
jgi:hypothetical protein